MGTANCPETPRQKMIGMMYLFYTALLALNVSGEIVNAFVLVNDSLAQTTENFHDKTSTLYGKLEGLKEVQPEKYQVVYNKAMEIRENSNELVNNIERLKRELIIKSDGEYKSVEHIKKKDDVNAAPEIMLSDGGPQKGDSLKMWVNQYRELLLKHVDDTSSSLYSSITSSLSTEDDFSNPEEKRTWEQKLFLAMPLVGSVAMMTKLQSDVRNTEADMVERLIVGVDELDITINDVDAIVNAESSYVVKGGDYHAEVFIAARDTSMKPTVYYSTNYPYYDTIDAESKEYEMRGEMGVDYDTMPIEEGKGIYNLENIQNVGTKSFGGFIEWNSKTGVIKLPFESEYLVGETGFAISPSGLNVFYRGIDNPVEVSVAGYPKEKVTAFMSGGGRLVPRGDAYVARITSSTAREVSISVSVETDDGGKQTLGTKKFRVLNVPTPLAKLNGTQNEGPVYKDDLMTGILMADLGSQFFPFKVRFDVVSFSFAYKVRGQKARIQVNGNRLNAEAKQALQALGRGTQINFESIKVKGPSGVRQTAPITLELK
ncbi:MAG: gliding motility protein GldM [Bacteroidales bacterium]